MILLGALAGLVAMRLLAKPWVPLRALSVSSANLAGVALFGLLGVVLDAGDDVWRNVGIVLLAYGAVLLGEAAGSRLRINEPRWRRVGAVLADVGLSRWALTLFAVLYIALPVMRTGSEGQLANMIKDSLAFGSTGAYTETVIEQNYAQATRPRSEAAAAGLVAQLPGFFLLAVGSIFIRYRRLAYLLLLGSAALDFVVSFGGRTTLMIGLGIPVILALTRLRGRWRVFLLGGGLIVGALLLLGALRHARSGAYTRVSVSNEIARTLTIDFAYGGRGLRFLHLDVGASLHKGFAYVGRMVIMPVPRSLWPTKPIVDPNWEMTEAFLGKSLAKAGSITLFTPLGEALFYFGRFGLILVPFAYGLLSTGLERLFLTSKVFSALFAQVLIWSFLCWRLTFWNLFGQLVVGNLAVLLFLWVLGHLRLGDGRGLTEGEVASDRFEDTA